MNEYPFVSIIIPVKNEEKYIKKCLDAVLGLNYPSSKYEVIVVDNNSTDNTCKIVNTYKSIKLLALKTGTIGAIRNYGAKYSKGDVIAFLDADCIPDADWIRLGCKYLLYEQNVSCVGFNMSKPSNNATWVEKTWYKMSSVSKYTGISEVDWLSTFNLMIKKYDYLKVGGFDEKLETCEDADLGYKLRRFSKLIFSDEITVTHLGNAKTIKEMFLKELWRGKSNLNSFLYNHYKINSLPSVLIPFAFTSLIIVFVILLIFNSNNYSAYIILSSFLIILTPIILSARKRYTSSIEFIQIMALYYVYLIARGLAVMGIRIRTNQ